MFIFWLAKINLSSLPDQVCEEGYYSIFGTAGTCTEMPGCSLCMGNQTRVGDNTTVISTSTRNFPNRLGKRANVYLSSSELAAITAMLGRLPAVQECMAKAAAVNVRAGDIYGYLNFYLMEKYREGAGKMIPVASA